METCRRLIADERPFFPAPGFDRGSGRQSFFVHPNRPVEAMRLTPDAADCNKLGIDSTKFIWPNRYLVLLAKGFIILPSGGSRARQKIRAIKLEL